LPDDDPDDEPDDEPDDGLLGAGAGAEPEELDEPDDESDELDDESDELDDESDEPEPPPSPLPAAVGLLPDSLFPDSLFPDSLDPRPPPALADSVRLSVR